LGRKNEADYQGDVGHVHDRRSRSPTYCLRRSKYQPPAIAVTFSPYFPPPTSLNTGSTTGIAAVVANDPKNGGVNFTCVPARDCGSFNPAQIASNVPTCYQAPGTVPSGSSVTLTAT